ncbi:DUF2892 domain-containing protein [Patescibacteria group bacterium]|nr:DUF2892 domain-containing protein [Patescibacteria group bacterium]
MFKQNEGVLDRLLRVTFGAVLLLAGIFWLAAVFKWIAIIIGLILLATGIMGFCGAYPLLKMDTLRYGKDWSKWIIWLWLIILIAFVVGGSYASIFFTKKAFLDDYNQMNNPYKQVLYQTGQVNQDEVNKYILDWQNEWKMFSEKYNLYRPWSVAFDNQFNDDLQKIEDLQNQSAAIISQGDLSEAHLKLEQVRPIFNDMLKRNGFSLEAVALVDFHDAMEVVLEAAEKKDAQAVLIAYSEADNKLKELEVIVNDQEIQEIRANLEAVKSAADFSVDQLPDLAAKLKSSYVKVYLKRG